MLRPAALTGARYRPYDEAELQRLEQILALRFIGLPLEQVKAVLGEASPPLEEALAMQREAIVAERARLDAALSAIERADAGPATSSWDCDEAQAFIAAAMSA